MYHQPLPPKPPSYMQCKNKIRIFLYRAESRNLGKEENAYFSAKLPWLFRLRQWGAQLTFETDCQNAQIAQLTFLLQVICGLCAVKPQKCAHSYGHYIYVHFCLQNCLIVEEIEFRRVWYWWIFFEKEVVSKLWKGRGSVKLILVWMSWLPIDACETSFKESE